MEIDSKRPKNSNVLIEDLNGIILVDVDTIQKNYKGKKLIIRTTMNTRHPIDIEQVRKSGDIAHYTLETGKKGGLRTGRRKNLTKQVN